MRVLLVGPQPATGPLLTAFAGVRGVAVGTARSVDGALDYLASEEFDCVVGKPGLPSSDTLADRIREAAAAPPAVILAGDDASDGGEPLSGRAEGVSDEDGTAADGNAWASGTDMVVPAALFDHPDELVDLVRGAVIGAGTRGGRSEAVTTAGTATAAGATATAEGPGPGTAPNGWSSTDRRLAPLHDVATDLAGVTDEQTVYELVVTAAEEILSFDTCVVDKVEEDGEHLSVAASSSEMSDAGYHAKKSIHEGIYGRTYRTGETQLVDDLRTDPDSNAADGAYRSLLSVPIGSYGVLQTASAEPGAFDEDDAEVAKLLAAYAATVLRRIKETEKREHQYAAAKDLHRATCDLFRTEDRTEVAEIAVRAATELLGLPITVVKLYDEATDSLQPAAYGDALEELFDDVPTIHRGEGIIWRAFESQQTEVHEDVHEDPEILNPDSAVRSQVVLPLGDHGVLVTSSTTTAEFSADDGRLPLLRTLAENLHAALDRSEREALLREQRTELEARNERLDSFASVVSHDLRNPLNVAMGNVDLAVETVDTDDDPTPALERATRSLRRMDELIDDLLSLAQAGASEERESVSLTAVVDAAWDTVDTGEATLERPDDLGTFVCDASRLRQLFENLFGNAVEHGSATPAASDGGQDPHPVSVEVGRTADGGFYVADDGPGIPPAERDKVLEEGYSTGGSTGYGLAIVGEIARTHGLALSIDESDAGGARFVFSR